MPTIRMNGDCFDIPAGKSVNMKMLRGMHVGFTLARGYIREHLEMAGCPGFDMGIFLRSPCIPLAIEGEMARIADTRANGDGSGIPMEKVNMDLLNGMRTGFALACEAGSESARGLKNFSMDGHIPPGYRARMVGMAMKTARA